MQGPRLLRRRRYRPRPVRRPAGDRGGGAHRLSAGARMGGAHDRAMDAARGRSARQASPVHGRPYLGSPGLRVGARSRGAPGRAPRRALRGTARADRAAPDQSARNDEARGEPGAREPGSRGHADPKHAARRGGAPHAGGLRLPASGDGRGVQGGGPPARRAIRRAALSGSARADAHSVATAAPTARARASTAAPLATTASDSTAAGTVMGASPPRPWPARTGASTTATTIWTTSTIGKTRVAGRAWRAVISLSSPNTAPPIVAPTQITTAPQAPEARASAANLVEKPVHAYASPAPTATTVRSRRRAAGTTYGRMATPPSSDSPSETASGPPSALTSAGAVRASPDTPAVMASTHTTSRRQICSWEMRAPVTSRRRSPAASAGCTTVTGTNTSAPPCIAHPPTTHRVP